MISFVMIAENELVPYLLGILGLLMTWELHDLEVRAGRIRTKDIRDLVGLHRWLETHSRPRLFVAVTPVDASTCEACRQTNGTVFSRKWVRNKKFQAPDRRCTNPAGCRCVLVGLVGKWPAAEQLIDSLKEEDETLLPAEKISELVKQAAILPNARALVDRNGIYMLEAMRVEGVNPQFAISRYRSVVLRAKEGRFHTFVVPAYLRLSDLLERSGRYTEALGVVDDFYSSVKHRRGPERPTPIQSAIMSVRRARLLRNLQTHYCPPEQIPSAPPA